MLKHIVVSAAGCHTSSCSVRAQLVRTANVLRNGNSDVNLHWRLGSVELDNLSTAESISADQSATAAVPAGGAQPRWSCEQSVILDPLFKNFPSLKSSHPHSAAKLLHSLEVRAGRTNQGNITNMSVTDVAGHVHSEQFFGLDFSSTLLIDNRHIMQALTDSVTTSAASSSAAARFHDEGDTSTAYLEYKALVASKAQWKPLSAAAQVAMFENISSYCRSKFGRLFESNEGRLWIDAYCSTAQVKMQQSSSASTFTFDLGFEW